MSDSSQHFQAVRHPLAELLDALELPSTARLVEVSRRVRESFEALGDPARIMADAAEGERARLVDEITALLRLTRLAHVRARRESDTVSELLDRLHEVRMQLANDSESPMAGRNVDIAG